jgi:hypothetical protein
MSETVKEGWSDMRPGDRVYHYMVDGTSLCRKVGFHPMLENTITKHGKSMEKGKQDCSPCFKKLLKRFVPCPGCKVKVLGEDLDANGYCAVCNGADDGRNP